MTKATIKIEPAVHKKVKLRAGYNGLTISEYLDEVVPDVEFKQ